ncbi:hypothetical protein EDD86DRAFT_211086 [Gorgonomyces haynaldii]|nr:hypothetical protein EDD86DRAFT_211086 [Gorgonomyces haynaldii]
MTFLRQVVLLTAEGSRKQLTVFWDSLATLQPIDSILRFQVIPEFFPSDLKSIYIRQSYVDLLKIIDENRGLTERRMYRMAITGTPGIGKSMFLIYVMWRLAQRKIPTVVLHRQKDRGRIYVFQRDSCRIAMHYSDVVDYLGLATTWYLTDTLQPPPAESIAATTILVSSPDRKHYKEFLKYSATAELHYLPVWSLDELNAMHREFNLTKEKVEERYLLIGGIPRYVLEKASHDLPKEIKNTMGRMIVDKLYEQSFDMQLENDVSHLVVHFNVDTTYRDGSLQFGSDYITKLALERFLNERENKLRQFLDNSQPIPLLATLRGNLFEAYAHRQLAAGGIFSVRSLDGRNTLSQLTLKKLEMARFYEIAECQKKGNYYIPWNPNYPCIDSYIPAIGHFQMTVSLDHPLQQSRMAEIVQQSGIERLYFVVPSTIFKEFPEQKLATKNASKNKRPKVVEVEQFALSIDLDHLNPMHQTFKQESELDSMS